MVFNQLSSIKEISIDGFQVVSGNMFAHMPRTMGPSCTLWWSSINFSKYALEALNKCEHVRIEVNAAKRCLLIIPVTASDRDGVRWVKNTKGNIEPRKMECKQFTTPLFETWGWDKDCVYRATGQLVTADKKVMLLFNFNDAESWRAKEQKA